MATQPLSLLSGEEIKSLALVEGSADENLYRASTYDLSIGEIIPQQDLRLETPSTICRQAVQSGSYRRSR